ncbi:MAG: hypothetical protein GXO91_03360 [FCB group bacterium]|nr:hypothetical protein [FCB group bacterium]
MKKYFVLLAVFTILWAEENFSLVRLENISSQDVSFISSLGIDLEGANIRIPAYLEFAASADDLDLLVTEGYKPQILQRDLSAFYASRLTENYHRDFGVGSMGGYYTFDEVIEHLDELHNNYPELVSAKIEIGTTYQNRPIYAVRISDNPDLDEGEPEILYTSLHHAREPQSIMTVLFFMYHLVENYGVDPEITALVDSRDMWFIPMVNPDGYEYNRQHHPDGGGMQRKNRLPGCPASTYRGVDPNRNYGFNWNYNDEGSSGDWCDETYRGTSAFSEQETQTVRDFVAAHNFKITFNYHGYGDLLIMPSGTIPGELPPDADLAIYQEYGSEMTRFNHYLFGTDMETVNYAVNGDSDSWMYNDQGIFAFTPEVGNSNDGFWPASDRIVPIAEINLYPNKFAAWSVGPFYRSTVYFEDDTFLPGQDYLFGLAVTNSGLSDAQSEVQVSVQLLGDASTDLETLFLAPLGARESVDLGLLTGFTVGDNAQNGDLLSFIVAVTDAQNFTFTDTTQIRIGSPAEAFADDAESGMSLWQSADWGVSDIAYEGQHSFTDSPDGEYPSNTNSSMTLTEPFDLSQSVYAYLQLDLKWDIENKYDFAQIWASTDAVNWTSLQGAYTDNGSGFGVQNPDEFGYDGQSDWVEETLLLDEFSGASTVWLKFTLNSDTYVQGDGIYVDDLRVMSYNQVALPGDLDDNGVINVVDIVIMIDFILGLETPTPAEITIADLNYDGVINILDVIAVLNYILEN